jgi:hypothetical protein
MNIAELWNLVPNELKLVFYTALPFVGKGIVLIPYGICKLHFSMEKTVFLCSLGSSIKVGYYFCLIYGAEKYLIRKGYLSVQKFQNWLERARVNHEAVYQCIGIMSLAILPNVGPGISTAACLAYVCGVRIFHGILVTVIGTTVTTYLIALGTEYAQSGISSSLSIISDLF